MSAEASARARPSVGENVDSHRHLEEDLARLSNGELPDDFAAAVDRLEASLARYLGDGASAPTAGSLEALEESLLGTLPEQVKPYKTRL